jgi:peptidyl-prolyl cis-trans isomerase SurA
MLKRLVPLAPVAVTLLVAALAIVPAGAQVLEQVLVRVNGEVVTKTQFEARQVAELRQRPELANVTPGSVELQRAVAEVTPELILETVDELLLVQRAREQGMALSDQQFNQIVTNIKDANDLHDEAKFEEALRQEGLTMTQLRQTIERGMLADQIRRTEVFEKINVTDAEARAYYEANRLAFTTPAQITLREILLEVPVTDRGVNVALDDEVRAQAEALRQRVLAGESFATLAGEHSAAASRANGGLIGPLSREDLAAQLQAMIDGLEVGEVTDVLRTTRGYQLLLLDSRTDSVARPFQDAYADISRSVASQKAEREMYRYLDRLREQANIVWRNDELQRAYEHALTERRAELRALEAAGPGGLPMAAGAR